MAGKNLRAKKIKISIIAYSKIKKDEHTNTKNQIYLSPDNSGGHESIT